MKNILTIILSLSLSISAQSQNEESKPYVLKSPDGSIELNVLLLNKIYYSVAKNSIPILLASPIRKPLSACEASKI